MHVVKPWSFPSLDHIITNVHWVKKTFGHTGHLESILMRKWNIWYNDLFHLTLLNSNSGFIYLKDGGKDEIICFIAHMIHFG